MFKLLLVFFIAFLIVITPALYLANKYISTLDENGELEKSIVTVEEWKACERSC